ncbi:BTB and TAZ domain protein 2 isoform 2 [Hibiscus syriacus]|uniref:BTB and TAZ domain protein 2 isoform 2 n=1 Tax=Hibiscus syriacus TaxID=106335 RepID=A0A6A2YX65_HIBSY|nr:BTB and TAZ domain protein 2 isoform 2 [Hibiscus syriacus]
MEDNNHNSTSASETDVRILTSGGLRIPAHSTILVMVSPVPENIIQSPVKHRSSERVIPILGVPCDAVSAFIEYLYNSSCTEEQMEKYGIHLLVLSHVYLVPQLKQRCIRGVSERLMVENVVHVLQLTRLCDVPDLHLKCLKQVATRFKTVEQTEGWKFMQDHDPWLELEILKFINEAELVKENLNETFGSSSFLILLLIMVKIVLAEEKENEAAQERTELVFTTKRRNRVFGAHLQRRVHDGGAVQRRALRETEAVRQLRDLLRLHSSVCDHPYSCRVPLCRQFKLKVQQKLGDDAKWKLLVNKVVSAKAMSSLFLPKRKREEELKETTGSTAQALKTFRLC